jgi:hypothetical protein
MQLCQRIKWEKKMSNAVKIEQAKDLAKVVGYRTHHRADRVLVQPLIAKELL